jgi:hypothetical protein
MGIRIQIVAILGSLGLLGFVFKLLQRRRLKEEYSILWLAIGVGFLLISTFRPALETFAQTLGIYYAPAALFLALILGAYLLLMHFSLVFSKLAQKNVELAQEVGLLRLELDTLRRQIPDPSSNP